MKKIGLIGGISWESTVTYYQAINRLVNERLGGFHSAEIILVSVDFEEIHRAQHENRWEDGGEILARAARSLQSAGAEFLLLCTNTMHKVAGQIEAAVSLPLLHIADATAASIHEAGLKRVGLLGTRFTMEEDFYIGRMRDRHGLDLVVPGAADRDEINRVIFEELVKGRVLDASRSAYRRMVEDLVGRGCEGIILGCTEIGMLLKPADAAVPLFDTAAIHARQAVRLALGET